MVSLNISLSYSSSLKYISIIQTFEYVCLVNCVGFRMVFRVRFRHSRVDKHLAVCHRGCSSGTNDAGQCIEVIPYQYEIISCIAALLGRNRFAKSVSNRFRVFWFRAVDMSNLKPVWRIRANRFVYGLVEQTKTADGEAIFLYSNRCLFRNLRLQSLNDKCVSDSAMFIC